MRRKWVIIAAVGVLVVLAGCSGILGDDGGNGSSPDWCATGQISAEQFQGTSGGEVTVNVEGLVERDGQELCKITYDYSDSQLSQYSQLELYFNEDFSTYEGVYYGPEGNEAATFDFSGMGSGGVDTTTGGSDDGGTTTGGSDVEQNRDVASLEGTISYGDTIQGELTADDGVAGEWREASADAYTFQGSSGDTVTISMESDPVDTYLFLEGPNGNLVAENDDSGFSLNSEIATTLPQDGTYTIWATTYSTYGSISVDSGPYTLSLARSGTGGGGGGSADVEGSVAYGQSINGRLTPDDGNAGAWRAAQADAYTFQGSSGDTVTISMRSEPVDTYLFLEGPNGNLVAENDDGGFGLNSQLRTTLPADGTYTIWASTFTMREWGEVSGAYTLELQGN